MNKIYQKNKDIVTRKIAGETILVPICGNVADMQRLFMLNPVAEFIWGQLERGASFDSICTDIVENFEVGRVEAEQDVKAFMEKLVKFDLVCEKVC